jgi:hypothetical protein
MALRKTHDAVATVGTYKDREGNEKKRYINIGSVFTDDEGRQSLKLDSVPVTPEWSGWVSFYEPKERQASSQQERSVAQNYKDGDGGDIPF